MKKLLILIPLIALSQINFIRPAALKEKPKTYSIKINIENIEGIDSKEKEVTVEYDKNDSFGSLRKKLAEIIKISDESKIRLTPDINTTTLYNDYDLNNPRYCTRSPVEFLHFPTLYKILYATTKEKREEG